MACLAGVAVDEVPDILAEAVCEPVHLRCEKASVTTVEAEDEASSSSGEESSDSEAAEDQIPQVVVPATPRSAAE